MVKTRKIAQSTNSSRASLDFTSGQHRFKFGRKTKSTSCEAFEQIRVRTTVGRSTRSVPRSHLLTNPEDGCDGVQTTFVNQMGLGESGGMPNALAAALMGVHTLGRARIENTGYDGWWSDVEHQKEFTNDYFISLLAKGWVPKRMGENKNQWERADKRNTNEMMLDSDMCLAYAHPVEGEMSPVNASRDVCCAWLDPPLRRGGGIPIALQSFSCTKGLPGFQGRTNCCSGFGQTGPKHSTDCGGSQGPVRLSGFAKDAVMKYAVDENAWLADFKKAWSIATTNGHSGLHHLGRCLEVFDVRRRARTASIFDRRRR